MSAKQYTNSQTGGTKTPVPQAPSLLGKRPIDQNQDVLKSPSKRPRIEGDLTSSSSNNNQSKKVDSSSLSQESSHPPRQIDFSFYNLHLLGLKLNNTAHKKDCVQIAELKSAIPHLQQNKLSDKMGRRDIQFYDLYKLNEPQASVQELKQTGHDTNGIYDPNIYEDIEVKDFNSIFRKEDLIYEQFG